MSKVSHESRLFIMSNEIYIDLLSSIQDSSMTGDLRALEGRQGNMHQMPFYCIPTLGPYEYMLP